MKVNSKKKNGGFSLVEVMMTVTIIAILSTTVTMSISGYVLEKKGEATVMEFYSQLQQIKSFAQRDNDRYLVVLFPPTADTAFRIYRDFVNSDVVGATKYDTTGKKVQLFADQGNVAKTVKITVSLPNDKLKVSDNNYSVTSGVGGEWLNPSLHSPEDYSNLPPNTIVFEDDEITKISKGVVFLQNNSAKDVYYAIVRPENENTLKLYKLKGGGSWKEL